MALYKVGPQFQTHHPRSYYANNRLSKKAEMHDFRPEKKKQKSDYDGFLGHRMLNSTRQRKMDITNVTTKVGTNMLAPILEDDNA